MNPVIDRRQAAWFLVAGALATGSLACQTLFGGRPPAEASATLAAFPADPALAPDAFSELEAWVASDPDGIQQAAVAQLDNEDSAVRFAALYVLSRTPLTTPSERALHQSLSSTLADERLLAAETLGLHGRADALPVLIDLLDSQAPLAHRDPPMQAWQAASFALIQLTEEDLGLLGAESFEAVAAAKPAWQAWWREAGGELSWDTGLEAFVR